jgi:hypothetical protein
MEQSLPKIIKNNYIEEIKKFLVDKSIFKDYKIYEYLWAIDTDMLMWEDTPPLFFNNHNIVHKGDYGIDLISENLIKTGQVKHYKTYKA